MIFDVAVLGAGPAGSTTAYHLACRGFKVALLDRCHFPRYKACGDILGPGALQALTRLGLSDLFANYFVNENWRVSFDDNNVVERTKPARTNRAPRWAVVPRFDLDAAILGKAQQAGAKVLENVTVRDVMVDGQVRVDCLGIDGGSVKARLVIVATGSMSKFSSHVPNAPIGFGIRGYYEGPPDQPPWIRSVSELLPGGYEWQFPITHTLYNIGIGTSRLMVEHKNLRLDKRLEQSPLVRDKRLVGQRRGGYLNSCFAFDGTLSAHANRVLKVGDAVGLVEPHLGEGIRSALHSAKIAAEYASEKLENDCLTVSDLAPYTYQLRREFGGSLAFARFVFSIMRHPRLWVLLGRAVMSTYLLFRPHEWKGRELPDPVSAP